MPNKPAKAKPTQKAERELKQELIQIRVTSEQRRVLQDAAGRAGLDLSSWLRMLALKAARDEKS